MFKEMGGEMIKPPKNKRKLASWRSYYRWYMSQTGYYIVTHIGSSTESWVLERVAK